MILTLSMNLLNNFNISFSSNPYLLLLGFLLIIFFSIYVYRTTLPAIGIFSKTILVLLRILGLSLILFLLFEPKINYKTQEIIEPTNLIFIDNSKSIFEFASAEETSKILSTTKNIIRDTKGITELYELGKQIKKTSISNIDSLIFRDKGTNISSIINLAKDTENLSSIILITDGIITEGGNPVSEAQVLGIPIYTIGVGDTSNNNDVRITKIKSNEFIYAGTKTEIVATVKHSGFTDENAKIKLIENKKVIDQKTFTLSASEINRIAFDYTNSESGKHKLTVAVEIEKNEKNNSNNVKSQIINIVDTKKKIFILSGSPNADLAAITKNLRSNKDFEVKSIVQLGTNKFYKNYSSLNGLNESDVLVLINFPSRETSLELINEVKHIITSTKKPFVYCLSSSVDYQKLNIIKDLLPFKILNNQNTYELSQVKVTNSSNKLLGGNELIKNEWSKLPPINITNSKIIPKISTDILLNNNVNNESAIIFSNNIANQKSIVINAVNFWKWKLKAPNREYNLFNNFIFNSVKWLTLKNDNNRFNVSSSKKSYSLGETIEFNASLYDETMEPVNNALIQLEIGMDESKNISTFNSIGNGLYETSINLNKPGLYSFTAKLLPQGHDLKAISGKFNIEPFEAELIESQMNKELLVSLANVTNGKFFPKNNSDELVELLNNNHEKNIKIKFNDNELILSSLEVILFIIIFLFGLEWLIRKVLKML